MNQAPLAQKLKRKIFIIADMEHGSDVSKNINKQLVEMAQVGKILYGIEGCYWNSDFPNKNCYGLEDPFVHYFIDSLNKLSYAYDNFKNRKYKINGSASDDIKKEIEALEMKSRGSQAPMYDKIFNEQVQFAHTRCLGIFKYLLK